MRPVKVVENLLEHHGVKGMKWGVRRKATVGAQEVIVRDSRRRVKTSGGAGHPASAEAIRARTIGQIGKKSGVKALSDSDLQTYTKRLNLEQQFKRLNYEQMSLGRKFVANVTGQAVKTSVQNAANDAATQQVRKRMIKMGALAA